MNAHLTDNTLSRPILAIPSRAVEQIFWLLLLLACNYPLLQGHVAERLVFHPQLVSKGEWQSIFLSPFTHLSWYHLGLDAAAFLLLWNGLRENRCWGRYIYLSGCWAGSLALPLLVSADIFSRGLCGLSGIAHGLFAVTALELIFDRQGDNSSTLGKTLLIGLVIKVVVEIICGGETMSALHFGDVGVPIVTSHLGGVIGGGMAFYLLRRFGSGKRYVCD